MATETVSVAKKFSIRDLGFDEATLKEIVTKHPKEQAIVNVLAFVSSVKVEPSRKDPSKTNVRFIGQFENVSLETGEEISSAESYFPGVCEGWLKGMFDGADGAVRVAFQVTVMKDTGPKPVTGYKFGLKTLVNKGADADPFKDLRNLLPATKPVTNKK